MTVRLSVRVRVRFSVRVRVREISEVSYEPVTTTESPCPVVGDGLDRSHKA